MIKELNKDHYNAMVQVTNGANVYSLKIARLLREVQAYDPQLVDILTIQQLEGIGFRFENVNEPLPYFGAILTEKGKELLDSVVRNVIIND